MNWIEIPYQRLLEITQAELCGEFRFIDSETGEWLEPEKYWTDPQIFLKETIQGLDQRIVRIKDAKVFSWAYFFGPGKTTAYCHGNFYLREI